MNALIDAAFARQRTVLTTLFAIILFGISAYLTIPKEADPDIPIPFVYVQVPHPGISPEDADRLIVKPMEAKLRSIEGLEEIRSVASEGHVGIILEFDVSFDPETALSDVREQVDLAKPDLPDDSEEPTVMEFNTSIFPIMIVVLSGSAPERYLLRHAQLLQDELEAIPSVLGARLVGQREELLEVIVDPAKLESYNISQTELINAVTLNNRLVAAGALDTGAGRFSVKVPGLFETAADVMQLPVKTDGESVVTLSDITEIRRTFKDADAYAQLDGEASIAIAVTKRIGHNILTTADQVRQTVDNYRTDLPPSMKIDYGADASKWVLGMLSSLESAVITAIALVMIVVLAALGLRSAMLVGISIPTSFLIGFTLLGVTGVTVNMMVMFGMILAVGILVDGAIVVVEFADRKMAEGAPRDQAYRLAAKRMFWPIVSSTATTLAAFVPMLFWPGVSGKFMSYLPITLIFVLVGSLLMALIFLPVLGSRFGGVAQADTETLKALAASEKGNIAELRGFTGFYARLLQRLIAIPGTVILAAIAALVLVVILYGRFGNGVEFFTDTETDNAVVHISARGNLSAEEMRALVFEVDRATRSVDGVRLVFAQSGRSTGGDREGAPKDSIGILRVELEDWRTRDRPMKEVLDDIRARTSVIPGIKTQVIKRQDGPPTGKDIQIELGSRHAELLAPTIAKFSDYMINQTDGLIEIDDTRPLPGIEWEIKVDREQAGRFGANVSAVGALVQLVTNGIKIGEYRPDDAEEEVEIRVRYPRDQRGLSQLDLLRVQTRDGLVPITNFVTRTPQPATDSIERVDGTPIMTIRANTTAAYLPSEKVAEITEWMKTADIDPRVKIRFRGANEEAEEAGGFLLVAFGAALFLMAIILITQFDSFYQSVLILSSVILSTVGVLLGMLVMNQTFSVIFTGTGIVALAGIVVNNNIVLIDTYQHLLREGFSRYEAIVRTGAQRLRPVLLTTATTVAGLMPMVLMLNIDFFDRAITYRAPVSLWWTQLATAVVFGLGFATLLTLIVTPCALALPQRLSEGRVAHRVGALLKRGTQRTPAE